MSDLVKELLQRDEFLQALIEEKEKTLALAPEGTLRATAHGKKFQFYHRTEKTGNNGKYLRKEEAELVRALARKEYDKRLLRAAEEEQLYLRPLREFYQSGGEAEKQYLRLHEAKRKIVEPFELPPEEFARRWAEEPFTGLEWDENMPAFYSERGERMRSKSEVIIANMLLARDIPYRYECRLWLGRKYVNPDFTILRKAERTVMYWDHMGLMDKEDYRNKNMVKIEDYILGGYFPGDNLILTFETSVRPLNIKVVEGIINRYFM